MSVIDSLSRASGAALLACSLLAACGGADPSVGNQDITFAIVVDEQASVAQGSSSAAPARVVDLDPPDEVPRDADEVQAFDAAVSLRLVAPMPPGVSADFAPATVRPGDTASLVVRAAADAQPGRHQLVVAGTLAGGSTTTRYDAHEISVTGACAAGTEEIAQLFPSRMARTIGLTRSGTVYLWGHNASAGSADPESPPVPRALAFYTAQRIDELPPALSAASTRGVSAVVLKSSGELRVLSQHYRSAIGAPGGRTGWFVQQVPDLTGFVQVVAQASEFFALHGDGTVWRFTSSIDDAGEFRFAPATQVVGLDNVTQLAAGRSHLLARRGDGSVLAMGGNDHGQLGSGDKVAAQAPIAIAGLFDITRIAAGDDHSLALRTDGTALAWGRGDAGQIGNGSRDDALRPVQVDSPNRNPVAFVIDVAAGSAHSLLHLGSGAVLSWGRGAEGQLGHGALEALNPIAVDSGEANRVFAAGNSTLRIVFAAGTVQGWGDNVEGQLGDGTALQRFAPVAALGLGRADQTCGGDSSPTAPSAVELSVAVQGPGRVSGSGFSCREGISTENCARQFASGSVITLLAEPDADSRFVGWSGCTIAESRSIAITLNASTRCFAQFAPG